MSVNAGNLTNASEQSTTEENNANNDRVSLELFEETIVATLEALNEQISNFTQLPNQLIHKNLAKVTPTVSA